MSKVLFLLRQSNNYQYSNDEDVDNYNNNYYSSGLFNSVQYLVKLLTSLNIDVSYEEVFDSNSIDRVVTKLKSTLVILEALWVPPSKLTVLSKLHKNITWVVRIHSELPFLANDSIALDWMKQYENIDNVILAVNSDRMVKDFQTILKKDLTYLPNYYVLDDFVVKKLNKRDEINIGCFGAVRPLKNQLLQAVSAIKFANQRNLKLNFYMNGSRQENNGTPVLNNIRNLFKGTNHNLIEIQWLEHNNFLTFLNNNIDIGLQVSFSETFNIVSADFIYCGIPIVVSEEIKFITRQFKVKSTSVDNIVKKLNFIYDFDYVSFQALNYFKLKEFLTKVEKIWTKFVG